MVIVPLIWYWKWTAPLSQVEVSLTKDLSCICLFKHNSIRIGEEDVCRSFWKRGIRTATWKELRGVLVYLIHVVLWICIFLYILPVNGSAPPEGTVPVDPDPGIYRPAPAQTNTNISHNFDFILANNKCYSKRPTCKRISTKSLAVTSWTRNVPSRTWKQGRDMNHTIQFLPSAEQSVHMWKHIIPDTCEGVCGRGGGWAYGVSFSVLDDEISHLI